jgi:hypothetical protein
MAFTSGNSTGLHIYLYFKRLMTGLRDQLVAARGRLRGHMPVFAAGLD